jgi:predicted dehydrogenase
MGVRIGLCGAGRFGAVFLPLLKAHPSVEAVVVADLVTDRAERAASEHGASCTMGSLEELCDSDVDAVALFTQRHLHGPQALQALEAGKHVYSAVPMGTTLDEVRAILAAVERTRLVYMTGETSYYYPATLYCRDRFASGDFGRFVYAEAQYLHDMRHFYASFQHSGGPEWQRVAGFPPMYYPTHSVSMVLSVTGARATHVSCLGFDDEHPDGIFRAGANCWDNPFSNESALMRTSDGGVIRINELRRVGYHGANSVYMSFFGTEACFEQNAAASCWVTADGAPPEPLTELLRCRTTHEPTPPGVGEEFFMGTSAVHPVDRLPDSFRGLPNGHYGSHQFLVDDFLRACEEGNLPPCNAWDSARWCIPGIMAHESALRNGEMIAVPDLGAARGQR